MTEAIEEYANQFPEEISKAIEGLNSKTERAIMVVLTNEGKLAFSELQEKLGDDEPLHPTTLSNSLSKMKRGGLIRKQALDVDELSRYSSYYSISEYGGRLVQSLFDSLGDISGPRGRRRPILTPSGDLYESRNEMRGELLRNMQP